MKVNCDVIMDLIPLVNDNAASDGSVKIVREHCSECEKCREFLDVKPDAKAPDEKIIKSIKKKLLFTQSAVALMGLFAGAWFTASQNMFYNFLIMPLVGGLSYLILRKKSSWALALIVLSTELVALIKEGFTVLGGAPSEYDSMTTLLAGNLYFGLIYAALAFVGMIIALLLSFVFRRENV